MYLDSFIDNNEFITADFYNKTTTITNGVPSYTWSSTADLSPSVLMWTGTAADNVVSEKYRADLAGVIAMNYEDYTTTINEDAKVEINGTEYRVIYVEDVANQNVLIQIPIKRK